MLSALWAGPVLTLLSNNRLLAVSRFPQDCHWALAPDIVFVILQSVDMQQTPPFLKQAVYLLPAARLQVVPCKLDDIQLPQGKCLDHTERCLVQLFPMLLFLDHMPPRFHKGL